ncbi:alkaline phosphatase D family protein [Actinopolymorpha alba]|uniref:alkaline phosphatase D family protein n=1 Tax=Actinopolymorpha alba TaxID=533267 RepID=UPI00035EC684|nr:alkaline phosphatase D family protein [Actinopolymorpha alba]
MRDEDAGHQLRKWLLASDVDRRRFLGVASAGAAALVFGRGPYTTETLASQKFADYPFQLGVASGDPLPDGVVLWTRLAPKPLDVSGGGGMKSVRVPVRWEVAEDERFRTVVRAGTTSAYPELAHSVHVEVSGLQPDRWYFYRFSAGNEISPVGRTKTAPAPGASLQRFNFAFASCQMYTEGYFTAYDHMVNEDLDLVVHLGDYIYEYGIPSNGGYRNQPTVLPDYLITEPVTLDRYRLQHAVYRSEAPLQAAHAAFPWIVTWDDHEVENNHAGLVPEVGSQTPTLEEFLVRRANAYRAYYEHMPLRRSSVPAGPDMQLYRRLRYGTLAEFNVLDTRQYRDDQAAGDGNDPPNPESLDPSRTLTGAAQEAWLLDGLAASTTTWKVIAQQVFMAQRDFGADDAVLFSMDAWDGYAPNRDRILGAIAEGSIANPVVLTGDVHANYANNLKANFDDPASPTIGVEFVGTSIATGRDGADTSPSGDRILAENPHIRFFNGQRGYVRCTVTPQAWQSDYRVVPYVTQPGGEIHTRASFVTEAGNPGLQLADHNAVPTLPESAFETEEERRVKDERLGRGPTA